MNALFIKVYIGKLGWQRQMYTHLCISDTSFHILRKFVFFPSCSIKIKILFTVNFLLFFAEVMYHHFLSEEISFISWVWHNDFSLYLLTGAIYEDYKHELSSLLRSQLPYLFLCETDGSLIQSFLTHLLNIWHNLRTLWFSLGKKNATNTWLISKMRSFRCLWIQMRPRCQ